MEKERLNWKQILATTVLTGIVTIGTGMILFALQQQNPRLVFSVANTIPFEGQQEKLAIYHVNIRNDGKRQVEDVACNISVKPANIKTSKVQADATLKYTESVTNSNFAIEIKGLNPRESVTISLLVSSLSSLPVSPEVALRGKDVIGEKAEIGNKSGDMHWSLLLLSLLGAYAGLGSVMFFQRHKFFAIFQFLNPGRILNDNCDDEHHRGDQNEIIAYLFGLQGLHEQVEYYLRRADGCSYWSESDRIASLAIHGGDVQMREKCIAILSDLLKYASSAPSSQGIIHYNLARILKSSGKNEEAELQLNEAIKTIPKLLATRLELDPLFKDKPTNL